MVVLSSQYNKLTKVLSILTVLLQSLLIQSLSATSQYLNEFAVFVPAGRQTADQLAAKHGFINSGQIGDLQANSDYRRIDYCNIDTSYGTVFFLTFI